MIVLSSEMLDFPHVSLRGMAIVLELLYLTLDTEMIMLSSEMLDFASSFVRGMVILPGLLY